MKETDFEQWLENNPEKLSVAVKEATERLKYIQNLIVKAPFFKQTPQEVLKNMGANGTFMVGLSFLRTADVLYLMGSLSQKEYDIYNLFQKKEVVRTGWDVFSCINIQVPRKNIVRTFYPPVPSFQDVRTLASNAGFSFDVTQDEIFLAENLIRSADLFELISVNTQGRKTSLSDEMIYPTWIRNENGDETEYNIVKGIALLQQGMPSDCVTDKGRCLLFTIATMRCQQIILAFAGKVENETMDNERQLRLYSSASVNLPVVNSSLVAAQQQERFAYLYHLINETKASFDLVYPKEKDEEWNRYLHNWLDKQVEPFIKSLSPAILKTSTFFAKDKKEPPHERD